MNHRKRILTALNHKEADRVPIDFGSYPGATSINARAYRNLLNYLGIQKKVEVSNVLMFTAEVHDEVLDKFNVDTKSLKPTIPIKEFNAPQEFIDKNWNVKWQRSSDFTYAPVEGPFQKIKNPSLDDLKRFKWPLPSEVEDPVKWRKKAQNIRKKTDRALVARMPIGLVTGVQFLRGFQGWAEDLYLNQKFSDALNEKYIEIWIKSVEGMLDVLGENVDVVVWGDDLGMQNQPMMNPKIFREKIKPLMKKQVESIKAKTNAKIALHTCGSVYEFIEDFIDIGIDVLNPLQSTAKDMEAKKIKEKAGNELVLWGGIDTHIILPKGKPKDVKEEVKRKISELGEGGGYILAADHNILVDIPPENVVAMFEAAIEYGKY